MSCRAKFQSRNATQQDDSDYYAILNVTKDASDQEIRNSYRKLALKYHPDRNYGNPEVAEQFKKISVAYAVLSDPNKRRQYDLLGPSGVSSNFEGFDVSELGGFERIFCALFSKIGVPIPTQIGVKTLNQARNLCEGVQTDAKFAILKEGELFDGCIPHHEAAFFKITMKEVWQENGVMICCKSKHMSKFKLILFDSSGGVRLIQQSNKGKACTSASLYYVPFAHANLSEFIPLKFYMEDKETPIAFHLLDTLEMVSPRTLAATDHILCVYGDNWISSVRFQLIFKALSNTEPTKRIIADLTETEMLLNEKKQEMSKFQVEYTEVYKKYVEYKNRLKAETEMIESLLKRREGDYDGLETGFFAAQKPSRGFFEGWY